MTYKYVYIINNPSYQEDVYKIGSSDDYKKRISTLYNGNTSVPTAFNIQLIINAERYDDLEEELHNQFQHKRINTQREFFKLNQKDIEQIFDKYCADIVEVDDNLKQLHEKVALNKVKEYILDQWNIPTCNIQQLSVLDMVKLIHYQQKYPHITIADIFKKYFSEKLIGTPFNFKRHETQITMQQIQELAGDTPTQLGVDKIKLNTLSTEYRQHNELQELEQNEFIRLGHENGTDMIYIINRWRR